MQMHRLVEWRRDPAHRDEVCDEWTLGCSSDILSYHLRHFDVGLNSYAVTTDEKFGTASWVVLSRSDSETTRIQQALDGCLRGYLFYPQVDWARYGYRPPDGHEVLGAWRQPDTLAFVFLLNNPQMLTLRSVSQFLVYAAGIQTEIERFEEPIARIKKDIATASRQKDSEAALQKRLASADVLRSPKRLMAMLGAFTVVVNAFAYYLTKLPPPPVINQQMTGTYLAIVALIHMSALLLLLVSIVICLAYMLKYGYLILRRL